MILCDTSALIALVNPKDKHHETVREFENQILVVPTTVLCEVDYMLTKYLGEEQAKSFFEYLVSDKQILLFDVSDFTRVNEIRRQYNSLPLGFVDASIVALAERHRIRRVLTLDRRHFTTVKPQHLDYLELLP